IKEENIYESRKRGIFRHNIDGGYEEIKQVNLGEEKEEIQIILGDSWFFLHEVSKSSGYVNVLNSTMSDF
ncbi:MAG: hypothetical protein LBD41_02225, partial [Clostridiales Family XIII bacterium]|nr:hypothetical protein [Clostridiales Family XIII bacterium]